MAGSKHSIPNHRPIFSRAMGCLPLQLWLAFIRSVRGVISYLATHARRCILHCGGFSSSQRISVSDRHIPLAGNRRHHHFLPTELAPAHCFLFSPRGCISPTEPSGDTHPTQTIDSLKSDRDLCDHPGACPIASLSLSRGSRMVLF